MMSIKSPLNLIIATYLISCINTSSAIYQEPVHFTRVSSSSNSQSTSSSSSSTTTTINSSSASHRSVTDVRSFPLTQDGVICYHRFYGQRGTGNTSHGSDPKIPPRSLANLTPFDCHVQCPPQTAKVPKKRDCQKIIYALKNSKKGSITIEPQSTFSVEYKECAVIFQNQSSENVAVMYTWKRLTQKVEQIQDECASEPQGTTTNYQSKSNDGMCIFSSCDVKKSIHSFGTSYNQNDSKDELIDQIQQKNEIMITIQRNRGI